MSNAVAFLTYKTGGCRANAIAALIGWALLLAQPAYADFTGKVVKVERENLPAKLAAHGLAVAAE
ncbi:MAG: hypothetical protein NUV75_07285, partial [Gallionella sp.]|nr:hypothetical protein [Gallionella sp.]